MHLPGKLRMSTLGDLLGSLHRAGISGVLALREPRGASAGQSHRIYLRGGLIVAIEAVAAGSSPPGPPAPMDRLQVQQRLEALFKLEDAELTFHVARGGTGLSRPLTPAEFLHGRPRLRDAGKGKAAPGPVASPARRRALEVLGLPASATPREVQRAFRALALRLHPDRHPDAPEERKAELHRAFVRLTQAYQQLTAAGAGAG